jgi:hypothetical protein
MNTSKKIRVDRARELAATVNGVSGFANKVGMSQSQASQIIGANPVKGIGDTMARRIEDAFGKSTGWLDMPATGLSLQVAMDAALQAYRAAQVVGKMDEEQFVKMFVLFCNMEDRTSDKAQKSSGQSIQGDGNFQVGGNNTGDIQR